MKIYQDFIDIMPEERALSTPLNIRLLLNSLCGKMGYMGGGAEYFLTFLDNKIHYMHLGVSPQNKGPGIQSVQRVESRGGNLDWEEGQDPENRQRR
jgi:hypothetical protein